jgi:hypothetical protein
MRSRISSSASCAGSSCSPSVTALAWRAVTALEAVAIHEGLLHRVRLLRAAEPFDRDDLAAVVHHRQGQAGIDALAVHQHGAGAALAAVAALLGAGQVQHFAQGVEQGDARFDREFVLGTVDTERERLRRRIAWRRDGMRALVHDPLFILWHGFARFLCYLHLRKLLNSLRAIGNIRPLSMHLK